MKITSQDYSEANELAKLQVKVDNLSPEYVTEISDEIYQRQPFFLTVLLGYRLDTTMEELEEIMKIYFLIWEYFKHNKNVKTKKVTAAYFEQVQNRNIRMLHYAEGEHEHHDKLNIYSNDLQNIKSKALIATVLFRYNNRPVLSKMEEKKKGIILVGIKSFIECFEAI